MCHTVIKTELHSVHFIRMLVSSALFKIKDLKRTIINSCVSNRKYLSMTAGFIQLTSRKDGAWWYSKAEPIKLFPHSVMYENLNSDNIMHTCKVLCYWEVMMDVLHTCCMLILLWNITNGLIQHDALAVKIKISGEEMSSAEIKRAERCAVCIITTLRTCFRQLIHHSFDYEGNNINQSSQRLAVKNWSQDHSYYLLITYLCVCFQNTRYLVVDSNCPWVSGHCCTTFRVNLKNAVSRGAPTTVNTCKEVRMKSSY